MKTTALLFSLFLSTAGFCGERGYGYGGQEGYGSCRAYCDSDAIYEYPTDTQCMRSCEYEWNRQHGYRHWHHRGYGYGYGYGYGRHYIDNTFCFRISKGDLYKYIGCLANRDD